MRKTAKGQIADVNHRMCQRLHSRKTSLQYICTQAGENRAGFYQKGSSEDGLNWAMRSPWQRGPPRRRARGECGREFHAEVPQSGGNRSPLFTLSGDSRGRGPSTHINELFTRALTLTHHYITGNNTYITRPCGH